MAEISHPVTFDRTVARRILSPATLVARNTPFGFLALIQQLFGKWLADKVGMPLRSREDDPVVVSDAGDPVRLESAGPAGCSRTGWHQAP